MITDANSLADACRAAESLASLSDAELPKYKALLAAMKIGDLHEAIELSQHLDDYILSPEQSDYEDIARGQLQFILGKRELETLLPHVNLYQYGRALQDRHQLALTDYGSVERRDNRSLMQPKGLTADSDGIAIDGHIGTWHVIDEALCTRESDGETVRCFLLEHDKRGDTTENLIVNEAKALVLDDVWNGFQDLAEAGWTVQPVERQEQDTPSMQQM